MPLLETEQTLRLDPKWADAGRRARLHQCLPKTQPIRRRYMEFESDLANKTGPNQLCPDARDLTLAGPAERKGVIGQIDVDQ